MVLACSALKQNYRDFLGSNRDEIHFTYLKGDYQLILDRMQLRKDHYMKPTMLKSQFDILEEPFHALTLDIRKSPDILVGEIITFYNLNDKSIDNL
jgi:gluconokinase